MSEKKGLLEIVLMPLVVVLVGTVSTHFITAQQHKSAETLAAADREVKLLEIFSEKMASNEESERIYALKLLGTLDSNLATRLAQTVLENEREQPKVLQTANQIIEEAKARENSLPIIYLHVRSTEYQSGALVVSEKLKNYGYFFPNFVRVVNEGPEHTQPRYFKNSEKSSAEKIVASLKEVGVPVRLQYISGFEESTVTQPLHFELWFALGEPVNSQLEK